MLIGQAARSNQYRIWGGGRDPIRETAKAERIRAEAIRLFSEDFRAEHGREPTTVEIENDCIRVLQAEGLIA
jgi:hypothetical protein